MSYFESQGCEFRVQNSASPPAYVAVGQVVSITDLRGGNATVIDVSNLASTRKEKRMGLPDEGQISLTLQYDPDDTQQTLLETKRDGRLLSNFQVALADSPPTTFTFQGYVLTFGLGIAVDDVVMGSVTVEITGAVTKA